MKRASIRMPVIGTLVSVFVLLFSASASAHVVVSPKQVLTAERTTFAVSVPNEHDTPVVAVRLIIPEGLTSVRPFAKQGWKVEVVKNGEGENVSATEIKWASDGANVPVDLKDDFLFGAKAPAETTELIWKAYETYQDGKVVGWDQAPSEGDGNKPYSITKVAAAEAEDTSNQQAEQAAADAKSTANRALYIAVAGLVVGLIGVFLAIRKQ